MGSCACAVAQQPTSKSTTAKVPAPMRSPAWKRCAGRAIRPKRVKATTSSLMESRMRRKMHVRFGERDRADRHEQSWYGGPVSTLCNPAPSPADVELTRSADQEIGREHG